MKKMVFVLLVVILLASTGGCAPATPTVDTAATQAAMDQSSTAAAAEAAAAETAKSATAEASATQAAATAEAQAAASATAAFVTQSAQSTADAAQAATATQSVKRTATAEAKKASTATAVVAATQQASDMAAVVTSLYDDGTITRNTGKYYTFQDFEESWAQLGWYNSWSLGIDPTNFVLRAHSSWEMATRTPDPSGCGFVFRISEKGDHFMVFLANTGYVWIQMIKNKIYTKLGQAYAAKVDPIKGEADIMLAVDGTKFSFYVNGERAIQVENQNLPEGALGLTLVSGTNKDFGTRCQMTGIELWDLGE